MRDCTKERGTGTIARFPIAFLVPLIACVFLSCSRTYEREATEFDPLSVIVPDKISTTASTRITFTGCILPDDLDLILTRQSDGRQALIIENSGPVSPEGCINEATFTPAYALESGALYTLSIRSVRWPNLNYTATVEATNVLAYRPGVYLLVNTDYDILDQFSEDLRTWFVEFTEPDEDGLFEIWLVDADGPAEGGDPLCFGWSAQPVSGGGGIGWFAFTQGLLNEKREQFSSPSGESMDIDVVPLACIKGARFEEQFAPSGETLSGQMMVEQVEIPCGVPKAVDKVFYTGRRCPDGTVLPHP